MLDKIKSEIHKTNNIRESCHFASSTGFLKSCLPHKKKKFFNFFQNICAK